MEIEEKEVALQLQKNLGSGQILEGLQDNFVVVVGENMLAAAYVKRNTEIINKEDSTKNTKVVTVQQEYILFSEVLAVQAMGSEISLRMKSGQTLDIKFKPATDINKALSILVSQVAKAN